MRRSSITDVLNELLRIHYRSLPMYLGDASPWSPSDTNGSQTRRRTLEQIIADHKAFSVRFADAIMDRGGRIESGGFPMEYTDLHLLSLEFLLTELVRYQQQDLEAMERLVPLLQDDPQALALAEEALGSARGHLENLQELAAGRKP